MYVGSFGKEFTDPNKVKPPGYGNMWVKVIDKDLRVRHEVRAEQEQQSPTCLIGGAHCRCPELLAVFPAHLLACPGLPQPLLPPLARPKYHHTRSFGNARSFPVQDWTDRYIAMRDAAGYGTPGYLLHETAIWNPFLAKWHFLPRRASKAEYSEEEDEKMGTNLLISTGPTFDSFDHVTVGVSFTSAGSRGTQNPQAIHCCTHCSRPWRVWSACCTPRCPRAHPCHFPCAWRQPDFATALSQSVTAERGFSSAKLIPGSKGRIIIALKSAESSLAGGEAVQTSFISIFTVDGTMLLEEEEITGGAKFEGIEFTT